MIGRPNLPPRVASEEAYCHDMDRLLMGRLHVHADSDEAKQQLEAVGLKDQKLVEQLAGLGVTPAGLMAVQVVPLVLVAWANHGVNPKERKLVMEQAIRFGVQQYSEAHALIEHWLDHRPSPLMLDTWKRLLKHELESICPKSREQLVALSKEQMVAVARCSGGFLGFLRVTGNERKLIAAISKVLDETLQIVAERETG
jgi:hypothetical protein